LRDLAKYPYTEDEQRVVAYFTERGVGGGDDPIGFLLASYAYLVQERNDVRAKLELIRNVAV
jgi:hypothetical protein